MSYYLVPQCLQNIQKDEDVQVPDYVTGEWRWGGPLHAHLSINGLTIGANSKTQNEDLQVSLQGNLLCYCLVGITLGYLLMLYRKDYTLLKIFNLKWIFLSTLTTEKNAVYNDDNLVLAFIGFLNWNQHIP